MKIDFIDVDSAISRAKQLLETERDISPALKSALEVILLLVTGLLNRVTLNSKNSSKPPASDPNRKKGNRKKSDKPSGGQKSHVGTTLQKIDDPDEIEIITIDRRTLPKGRYTADGFETRQVFDIDRFCRKYCWKCRKPSLQA
ncbi:transposase, IS66 family [Bathymodiolus platifrons methanotrophic gill symbiont]|nr:transposase, IS66 family [Bathymodiolus platifrons methanotrophic gill symbiont]